MLRAGKGRAIAQAVSRWLPTAAASVRARVWSSGICGGQSGAGAGFLRVLRFSLPISIPQNSPSSQSPEVSTIGPLVADMPSGLSLDSTPTMRIKKITSRKVAGSSRDEVIRFFSLPNTSNRTIQPWGPLSP
jgi:hypothetical protein